jgi:hypothetical protein
MSTRGASVLAAATVLLFLIVPAANARAEPARDSLSLVTRLVEDLYCKPLGLRNMDLEVTTRFLLGEPPTTFRVLVKTPAGPGGVDGCVDVNDLKPRVGPTPTAPPRYLLRVDVLVEGSRIASFHARGPAMRCSEPIDPSKRRERTAFSLALAGELVGWAGVVEIPARGGGTVLGFRLPGDSERLEDLDDIGVNKCNGLLEFVGDSFSTIQ